MEDLLAMQQAAQERVRRMQAHARRLCTETVTASPKADTKPRDNRLLLLLLVVLLLAQQD